MSVTFFYSPQSSATRTHWALEELGIPYEKVKIDLRAGDQKKPEFIAINPNGKVPAVVVDGQAIFESGAIAIFLGERYGVDKGMWPAANTPERAQALSWLLWGQVALGGLFTRYFYSTGEWTPVEQRNPNAGPPILADIHAHLKILDQRLEGREYIVGNTFNLADLDIAAMLGWAMGMAKIDGAPYKNLQAWLTRVTDRKGFKTAMAA